MTASATRVPPGMIGLRQMCHRTGATYRMLERWCTLGVIPATWGTHVRGSGGVRAIDAQYEPIIRLLAKIQAGTDTGAGGMPYPILSRIVDEYRCGYITLDGFTISWEVES